MREIELRKSLEEGSTQGRKHGAISVTGLDVKSR